MAFSQGNACSTGADQRTVKESVNTGIKEMCDFKNTHNYIRDFMQHVAILLTGQARLCEITGSNFLMCRYHQEMIPNRKRLSVMLLLVMIVFADSVSADTVDIQIAASRDDAEERSDGSIGKGSPDLELVFNKEGSGNSGNQTVGMRFNGVNIPKGSHINNAYIQFTADEKKSLTTVLLIEGEATDNPSDFTNSAFNISSRPRTAASVGWSPAPWQTLGQAGPDQRTENIAPIIQEIVNRSGWSSGNSLVIIITGSGERVAESYNGDQAAAPRLHIEFSDAPAETATLDVKVASNSDDAEEEPDGTIYRGSSDLELVFDHGARQTVGLRFNGVNIPQGTSVTDAYIQFTVDEKGALPTALTIEGEATDNPSTFINSAFDISSRPRTVKDVAWFPVPWPKVGAAGPDQRTANIAPVIQEIVNRPGWSSGNSLVLIITGHGERVAESFNGKKTAAPRLHVEFAAAPGHQPPLVNAGADARVILPNDTILLGGTANDDGLPDGMLTSTWSHVGGTGTGTVTFGDAGVVDTTATFTADPGIYVLRLSANDGEFSSFDDVAITVNAAGAVQAITQVGHFLTGFDASGNPRTVPGIDPAGVVYHEPSGRLFISDSEINEVAEAWNMVQANLFETSLDGNTLFDQWNINQWTGNEPDLNNEPTGITFCPGDAHFYVTNDNHKLVYRYAFDGATFTAVDAVSTLPFTDDPEGITCDPVTGRIYVIGGHDINILVYSYNSGFVLEEVLDLAATAGSPAGIPKDPEGIAFDPVSGNLFLVCSKGKCLLEYTTAGVFIKWYDINGFSPRPVSPQGISIGTSSANPQTMSFYIADALIDNGQDPDERDGVIFEAEIQREP
jgi:hypothetical protein